MFIFTKTFYLIVYNVKEPHPNEILSNQEIIDKSELVKRKFLSDEFFISEVTPYLDYLKRPFAVNIFFKSSLNASVKKNIILSVFRNADSVIEIYNGDPFHIGILEIISYQYKTASYSVYYSPHGPTIVEADTDKGTIYADNQFLSPSNYYNLDNLVSEYNVSNLQIPLEKNALLLDNQALSDQVVDLKVDEINNEGTWNGCFPGAALNLLGYYNSHGLIPFIHSNPPFTKTIVDQLLAKAATYLKTTAYSINCTTKIGTGGTTDPKNIDIGLEAWMFAEGYSIDVNVDYYTSYYFDKIKDKIDQGIAVILSNGTGIFYEHATVCAGYKIDNGTTMLYLVDGWHSNVESLCPNITWNGHDNGNGSSGYREINYEWYSIEVALNMTYIASYSKLQPVLSVNPVAQNLEKEAGNTSFSVSNTGTGTMSWTSEVISGGDWLTIKSGASGADTGTITCSYTANTGATSRTGTIRVTATSATGSPKDIAVTQAGIVNTGLSPVPDTGQTTCYDSSCKSGTCPSPGESLYGQDANYSINPMSYTKLDDSGNPLPNSATSWAMVRDNVTHLVWEMKNDWDGVKNYKNQHDADNIYTWYDGSIGTPGDDTDTDDFIKALNNARYGGYSDWRLPTIKELTNLVLIKTGKAIDTGYFPNIQGSEYWSSTPFNFGSKSAWCLNFNGGGIHIYERSRGKYSCAVRGEKYDSSSHSDQVMPLNGVETVDSRYVDNNDGTVSDTITGLMWQKAMPDFEMTWAKALEYCENSTLANYSDWRLPTLKELISLVDYNRYDPTIDISFFPNTAASHHWTSTTGGYSSCYAWLVDFYKGNEGNQTKSWDAYVRPVRGGQANASGYLVVSPLNRTVSKDAGSTTFSVSNGGTGTMPWSASITTGSDWLKITNGSSGTNSGTITCSYSANTGTTGRTGTIRVTATGTSSSSKDVTVTQDASSGNIIISGNIKTGAGAFIPGATVTFTNNGGTGTTDASGNYSVTVPNNYSGTATPSKTGYSFSPASKTYSNITANQTGQNYTGNLLSVSSGQFLGVWSDGVWVWNKTTNTWSMMASTANVSMIAAGKIDTDQIDDLIGVWPSGLYVRQSTDGQWLKLSAKLPAWITAGDLNNDGRDDVIATWSGDATYYRDSAAGNWIKLTSPAKQLAAGNIGGNRDDLAGVWSDGIWVRYSADTTWKRIDVAIPIWIAVGDITGDNRADIIGSYSSGTWYRNSATAGWTLLTTPATQLAVGDIDGDGRDDLVGIWSNKVYVLYGATNQWQMISASKPNWITTGKMAAAVQTAGTLDDPNGCTDVVDLSSEGPGGETFEMMTDCMEIPITVK